MVPLLICSESRNGDEDPFLNHVMTIMYPIHIVQVTVTLEQ